MKTETVLFAPDGRVSLTAYIQFATDSIPNKKIRPGILVIPGGGYGFVSPREAEPVALAFLARGFNAFVLRYSVAPHARFPAPQREAFRALALIRDRAEEWNTDPDRLAVCGFSAGGHLAACTATLWHRPEFAEEFGGARKIRPDAAILSYPVITSGESTHAGSMENLLGENPPDELRALVSAERQVTSETPPVFLWHTADDPVVPSENSLMMAAALRKAGVPFELHIYQSGPHGLSLSTEETGIVDERSRGWTDLAPSWLASVLPEGQNRR